MDNFKKTYTHKDLESGTNVHGLNIWLDAVDRQLKELQEKVGFLRIYAEKVIEDNLRDQKEIREDAKKRGKEIMDEREKAEEAFSKI